MHKCNSLPLFVAQDGQVWIKKKIKLAFSKFYLMVFVQECRGSLESTPLNVTECINWNLYYTDCKPGEINPFSGAISFDNIGLAWVAIFLVRNVSF